jgi:1-acyl-sn-glycerol-3-phosphate acyltransferase
VSEAEPIYTLVEVLLRPAIGAWFSWHLEGMDLVPPDGPVLVAGNHVSHFDPLAHGYLLTGAGRRPRYLAKSELWHNAFLRKVLNGTHQIPVDRGTGRSAPVDAALKGLDEGQCVVVYPEATTTRNPDKTPMQGKTGIARIALRSGAPVLPLAVWGTHHILQRGEKGLNYGRAIWVRAGRPMEFDEYAGRGEDPAVLRKVTDEVMDELTRLVQEMRRDYPSRWA